MDFISKACDATVKVVITIAVVGMADKVGVFNPIKRWWKRIKEEADK